MDIITKDKDINLAILTYRNYFEKIDFSRGSQQDRELVLELLMYRDSLESFWAMECNDDSFEQDKKSFIKLAEEIEHLDKILLKECRFIVKSVDLEKWRAKLEPSEDAWWWFLENEANKFSLWYKFDWFWNTLTAISLAIAASFMISIYAAVSMGDANFATALSTIAQLMGLAVIGGGALSDTGKEAVQNVLSKMHISKKFFAEATFVISFLFMYGTSYINNNLDNYYHDSGLEAYESGDLSDAIAYMLQAKEMNPNGIHYDGWIGKSYESLGNLDQASVFYLQSVENGNFHDLNSLGRVFINKIDSSTGEKNLLMAESYLLLALQRLQTYENSEELKYRVRTNMGWVLLEQKKYDRAKAYLDVAIERHKNIKGKGTNNNMAYCFMAQLEEERNNTKESADMWVECMDNARPEFVHQYNWFMSNSKEKIAYCIDTSHVVSGFNKTRNKYSQEFCDNVKKDLTELKLN